MMFKIGDRVICVNEFESPYQKVGTVIGFENQPLVKFENWVDGHFGWINKKKLSNISDCWFLNNEDLVSEEVYHSPLFQAMREEK